MRKILILFSVCLQFISFPAAHAKALQRCHMCGMDAAKSQTEFVVHFGDTRLEHTCCLHCVYLLQNFMKDHKVTKLETRDFSSGTLIDAGQAYYLEGSSLIPKGSMAPFLLAFSDKAIAEKYARKYKGSVVGFKEAMDIVAGFDAEITIDNHKH